MVGNFYFVVIRPIIKWLLHLITRKSEIQRNALLGNHLKVCKYILNKEYSIQHSKQLNSFKQIYKNSRLFHEQMASQLCKAKSINNERNKFMVVKILRQIYGLQDTIKLLKERRQKKFEKGNQQHELMLLGLWNNLKKQKLQNRITNQWISIGFQGDDPATDFRGAGIQGLHNLFAFSQFKICTQIFKVASNPETHYFFCSAGLYFTILSEKIIQLRKLPYKFWLGTEKEKIQKAQMVYNTLFVLFQEYWIQCADKSLMEFNRNLQKFGEMVKSLTCEQFFSEMTRINAFINTQLNEISFVLKQK